MKKFKSVQSACDYAIKKCVEQGGQSSKGDDCVYYCNGKRCPVGWLLNLGDAQKHADAGPLYKALEKHPPIFPDVVKSNVQAFASLQIFHDQRYRVGRALEDLSKHIDTETNPAYRQWVDLMQGAA